MSAVDSPFKLDDAPNTSGLQGAWERIEGYLERLAERLNPILVKEARQALKSRQFIVTFSLLLGFGWGWTFLGIGWWNETVFYGALGPEMLIGYYFVLAVPLLLVVPFSAFRSLAAEREDGTFELVSITALTSRQIVTGKLGSAVLQMIVYYSALSPAIVFTYMLRGIDVLTICLILFYTFLVSLMLSAVGLLVATITQSRNWQVFLSVVLLLALVMMGIWWSWAVVAVLYTNLPYEEPLFWATNLCILSFYISFLALAIRGAAGQISFASENRATILRVIMLTQQLLWIGWMVFYWLSAPAEEWLLATLIVGGIYWLIAGALMSGETAELSPRAQRELPQSFLGRTALTWFNPGSGTGYVFAMLNLAVLVMVVILLGFAAELWGVAVACVNGFGDSMLGWLMPKAISMWVGQTHEAMLQFGGRPDSSETVAFGLLLLGYTATYIGITRIVHLFVRRYFYVGLMFSLLVLILLLVMGSAAPFVLEASLYRDIDIDYSELQVTNWWWTLLEALQDDLLSTSSRSAIVPFLEVGQFVVTIVVLAGLASFGLNLVLALREVEAVRQETPDRVVEDERELHPERDEQAKPASPWDTPDE